MSKRHFVMRQDVGIGREGYGAYSPQVDDDGTYYVNVYSSGCRVTVADDLTAAEAIQLAQALERVSGRLLIGV